MEYFCCYHSYLKKCEKLTDQELGRLFRALLYYSSTGQRQELAGRESIAFDFIADDIDRAQKSYAARCQANSEKGKLGGRPKKQEVFEKAVAFSESQKSQNKEENKNKDKDKKEEIPPNPPKGVDDGFAAFWDAYPKKVGKKEAKNAWNKLNPDDALKKAILDAVKRQKRSEQWKRENGQFIPYPATWLKQQRWEDELKLTEQKSQTSYDIEELEAMSFFHLPEDL